jgi:hypothetical protein
MDTRLPLRANHRFLQRLYSTTLGGKVEAIPKELDLITRVFKRAGGSWEGIFQGSPKDTNLLKRVLKAAVKLNLLTKKPNWGE